jgi:hypothetical protein
MRKVPSHGRHCEIAYALLWTENEDDENVDRCVMRKVQIRIDSE